MMKMISTLFAYTLTSINKSKEVAKTLEFHLQIQRKMEIKFVQYLQFSSSMFVWYNTDSILPE